MMGTLAIMGVIIMTGVVMYRAAMNRHYANVLIEEGHRRAVSGGANQFIRARPDFGRVRQS